MRHVCLEAERLRPANQFQELDHSFPTVHSAPTNLSFSRQTFALALRDIAAFSEGRGDLFLPFRIIGPSLRIRRRVNPNHTIWSDPEFFQLFVDPAFFGHLFDKPLPLIWLS